MSHSTVSHKWFHQIGNLKTNRNEFSFGSMFYHRKIVYSYGKHFAIAIRFDDKVVFNSKGYSKSTAKHKSYVLNAIDVYSHEIIYVPLNEAYYINTNIEFKKVYKHLDFESFVSEFNYNIKKLKNARKPEIYIKNISEIQSKLNKIFSTWYGSKTFAIKNNPKIKTVLNFSFDENMQTKLKNLAISEKRKKAIQAKKELKEAQKSLRDYESLQKDSLKYSVNSILGINTAIRVKNNIIETSKGMKIDLNDSLRMFNLWLNGNAIGKEIETKDGHTWKCTKANGIIKFGCHEINFDQAKRILTPYL